MGRSAQRFWLRSRRRLADVRSLSYRRRFRQLRMEFYERLWRDTATDIGATVSKTPDGLTQITKDSFVTFTRRSELMLDSAITTRLLANKTKTYSIISGKGYPVVPHCAFTLSTFETANDFMRNNQGPFVVKPADGTGAGRGITTGITSLRAAEAAAKNAAGFHPDLLIEKQLSGASFRLLYLNGELIDAVRRDSPALTGDGRSTIRQLAAMENESRISGGKVRALSPLVVDLECRNTLASQGWTPSSILSNGQSVKVKLAVNENAAAQNRRVLDDVHPEIAQAGQRIVRDLGVKFAGLDFTADDISAPLARSGGIFNEVNVNPGLHHHYLVSNPEAGPPVASQILKKMFETGEGVIRL